MPELDDAEVRAALEALRDGAAADVDVEERLDELHARTGQGTARRRWGQGLLAAAAVVALVAGSVTVFRDGGDRVVTSPADHGYAHDPDAKAILDRAVQATRDAPGWVAEVSGGLGRMTMTYQEPNRIDSDFGQYETPLERQIVIGTDSWTDDGGGWVADQRDWRTVAPFTLLDALSAACVAEIEEGLLAWDGTDGCARPVDQAFDGTDVWLVGVDVEGRLARIDTGELQPGPVDPEVPRPGLNRLARLPVGAHLNITFRYDNVPEVTAPADGGILPSPNEAEMLLENAYATLGSQVIRGWGCCLQAPGSDVAHVARFRNGVETPVVGSPVGNHTYDHEGSPAVIVLNNDYVVDAEPVELSGAPGVAGNANGYPFAAFTCGGYLWTVGGLVEEAGPPVDENDVLAAAADLAGALSCEPDERPIAPGHGDPHG